MSRSADEMVRLPRPVAKRTALAGWTMEIESGLRLTALVGALLLVQSDLPATSLLRRKRQRLPVRRAPPGRG